MVKEQEQEPAFTEDEIAAIPPAVIDGQEEAVSVADAGDEEEPDGGENDDDGEGALEDDDEDEQPDPDGELDVDDLAKLAKEA